MSYLFLLIRAEEEPTRPVVFCSTIAESIDKVIEVWIDPGKGYVPDHIDNVRDDFDDKATEDEIRAYAIAETKKRFGIGFKRSVGNYSEDWMIVQVDLGTGKYKTYPGKATFEKPSVVNL